MNADCIFCKIIAGAVPATVEFEDDFTFVIRDINPAAPIHLLILPKRHIHPLADGAAENEAVLGRMLAVAAKCARRLGVAAPDKGYRLVINQGPDGGQDVDHLHLHLLGGQRLGLPH